MNPDKVMDVIAALEKVMDRSDRICIVSKQLGIPKSDVQYVINDWCQSTQYIIGETDAKL